MSEELYFNNELRKCLDAAGLSDCGENDCWNYWYQRLHKAHDAAVDRVTDAQRAENAKLRELVRNLYACINNRDCDDCEYIDEACEFERNMRELGVEV